MKVSTDANITQATVKEHLAGIIEGIPIKLGDDTLAEITNTAYLRKVYKLNTEPKHIRHFTEQQKKVEKNSVQTKDGDNRRLREYMESVILGTIALKGW